MWKRTLKGRRNTVILILIFLVSFGLMTADSKRTQGSFFFESFFLWIISPVQSLITTSADTVSDVFNRYLFLVDTDIENERLHLQVDELKRHNNMLREEVRRLNRVGHFNNYREEFPGESLVATIVARDATQWVKTVIIDKGTQDGLRENLAVVTDVGVVGHIIQVGPTSSKVLLMVDRRSAIDALFEKSRVPGVVVGQGTDTCEIKYVPITAEVNAGDWLLSSGLGGVFPKGLAVGRVLSVTKNEEGLFQEIRLVPGVNLSRLEEVLVLLP